MMEDVTQASAVRDRRYRLTSINPKRLFSREKQDRLKKGWP
jgi:hypothetical protein